eukprot:361853-Chlamydomonas_euryale.AAC.2
MSQPSKQVVGRRTDEERRQCAPPAVWMPPQAAPICVVVPLVQHPCCCVPLVQRDQQRAPQPRLGVHGELRPDRRAACDTHERVEHERVEADPHVAPPRRRLVLRVGDAIQRAPAAVCGVACVADVVWAVYVASVRALFCVGMYEN